MTQTVQSIHKNKDHPQRQNLNSSNIPRAKHTRKILKFCEIKVKGGISWQ